MWKPLFLYYFLLIATMTKTMFVNSQQLLIIILLYLQSLLSIRSIWSLYFFLFFLFLLFTKDHSKIIKPLTQHWSLLYSSRTRFHRGIIKQNSKLYHTKNFILLDQDITKRIKLSKTVKIGVWCDAIPGHLPQAWQMPRGVPIPMWLYLFLRRWWCDILGYDTPQDTILLLELVDLPLKIHYFLMELTRDS